MTTKPVGWRKESQRHALAAKGIETGRKSTASQPSYSAVPKETPKRIEIGGNNWSVKCDPDGSNAVLRMDDHIGWRWDGDETSWDVFIIRMAHSKLADDFAIQMGEADLDYDTIKKIIADEDYDLESSIYSATGDNVFWHFGDTDETEYQMIREYARDALDLNDAQMKEFEEHFWGEADLHGMTDFDTYMKESGTEDYGYPAMKKELRETFSNAESWDDIIAEFQHYHWLETGVMAKESIVAKKVYPELERLGKPWKKKWEKEHPKEVLIEKMKNDQAQQKLTE
jgi:hypothetical protein